MADSLVEDLTAASTLGGSEFIYGYDGLNDVYITPSQIGDYILGRADTAELIRDTIGATLVAGSGISIVVDDSPNTITISATGSSAFSGLTGGTNTSAAMVVGTGASLSATGSGTIHATTADALHTARTIGGVIFDGTGNITVASATGGFAVSGGNLTVAGQAIVTTTNSSGFAVGANGSTGPAFVVDCSIASQASGIKIIGHASGSGVTINAIGGTNEGISIVTKGSGSMNITGGGSMTLSTSSGAWVTASNTQVSIATPARSATANHAFQYTLPASGTGGNSLTAGTESHAVYFNLSANQTHDSTTGITTQRDLRINPSTHLYRTSSGTITDAMGVSIDGAPIASTHCAITTSHALYIGGRAVGSGVTSSYGLTVNPNTGATNNYAAQFLGLTGIGRGAPTAYGDFAASTTSNASVRIRSGTAPTSPNEGDMWYDGTNLKFRDSTTSRTITWT